MSRVLVCDDEKDILAAITIFLQSEGHEVLTAENGQEAIDILQSETKEIQLLILDIMMPVMDGITALSKIRSFSNIPVILLTAKSEDIDKILGLNVGADDYVTKPFQPMELMARVRSQLRRYTMLGGSNQTEEHEGILRSGGLELDDRTKEVHLDGNALLLTPLEYDLLKFFLEHPGEVFSPKELYTKIWKEKCIGSENTVAVHIRHLREKIEIDPSNPRYLKVVWGHGYKLESHK